MIGKSEWFTRKKYGWGICPKSWQGWVYLLVVFSVFIVILILPFWSINIRLILGMIWLALLLIDVFDIGGRLQKSKIEQKHEAIENRNALWVIIMVLIVSILYQLISSIRKGQQFPQIDYFILAALLAGAVMKTVTAIYLRKKEKNKKECF